MIEGIRLIKIKLIRLYRSIIIDNNKKWKFNYQKKQRTFLKSNCI